MDNWTGDPTWVRQRPRVAKSAYFLVEEREKVGGRAKKEGLAISPPLVSNLKSEPRQRATIRLDLGQLREPRPIVARRDNRRPLSWKGRARPAWRRFWAIRRERKTPAFDAQSRLNSSRCFRYAQTKVLSGTHGDPHADGVSGCCEDNDLDVEQTRGNQGGSNRRLAGPPQTGRHPIWRPLLIDLEGVCSLTGYPSCL